MIILKIRKPKIKSPLFKASCIDCGSRFGIEFEDITVSGLCDVWTCPVCGRRNIISDWDLETYRKAVCAKRIEERKIDVTRLLTARRVIVDKGDNGEYSVIVKERDTL